MIRVKSFCLSRFYVSTKRYLIVQPTRCATGSTTISRPPNQLNITPEDARKIQTNDSTGLFPPSMLPLNLDNMATLTNRPTVSDCIKPCIAIRRKLFTPGPLMVSDRVKSAMLTDIAKRHADFAYLVKFVRSALLQVAKVDPDEYTAILTTGSGTGALEGTIKTVLGNSKKKLLVLENGRYALRTAEISRASGINVKVLPLSTKSLQDALLCSSDIGAVLVVHCETSTGLVNPVNELGDTVKKCSPECLFIVDAVTSFGSIPLKMKNIDFLISNPCKSLQGVPGISFIIANRESLEKHRNPCMSSHGLVLDIAAQNDELERSGMFRNTPPTHVMLAFKECLLEYSDEGGIHGRAGRFRKNTEVLKEEMAKMGFKQLYDDDENPDGFLVTSFLYPSIPQFVFDEFSKRLSDAGHVICNDKTVIVPNCFRVGCIGDIREDDIRALTNSIRDVCGDMRIGLPLTAPVY